MRIFLRIFFLLESSNRAIREIEIDELRADLDLLKVGVFVCLPHLPRAQWHGPSLTSPDGEKNFPNRFLTGPRHCNSIVFNNDQPGVTARP
jgi:hypothetical protein